MASAYCTHVDWTCQFSPPPHGHCIYYILLFVSWFELSPSQLVISGSGRLRWYGHVMRKNYEEWVKKCMEFRVEGR